MYANHEAGLPYSPLTIGGSYIVATVVCYTVYALQTVRIQWLKLRHYFFCLTPSRNRFQFLINCLLDKLSRCVSPMKEESFLERGKQLDAYSYSKTDGSARVSESVFLLET